MSKLELIIEKVEVKWYGYVVLILGVLFFLGIFKDVLGLLKVLDFNNVLGFFGILGIINDGVGILVVNFRGDGGIGF